MPDAAPLKTVADHFFFYLERDAPGSDLLALSLSDARVRAQAVCELVDLSILLGNHVGHPRYRGAFGSLAYRVRALRYPEALLVDGGMVKYFDYLLARVRPSVGELSVAGSL